MSKQLSINQKIEINPIENRQFIKTVADIKRNIGSIVYWDDIGSRYTFLRSGVLSGYDNGIVTIDCNELRLPEVRRLTRLRNFKD